MSSFLIMFSTGFLDWHIPRFMGFLTLTNFDLTNFSGLISSMVMLGCFLRSFSDSLSFVGVI